MVLRSRAVLDLPLGQDDARCGGSRGAGPCSSNVHLPPPEPNIRSLVRHLESSHLNLAHQESGTFIDRLVGKKMSYLS